MDGDPPHPNLSGEGESVRPDQLSLLHPGVGAGQRNKLRARRPSITVIATINAPCIAASAI